jgi:hypothetical protein
VRDRGKPRREVGVAASYAADARRTRRPVPGRRLQGGAPTNPAWVNNLRTDPQVEVWDGPEKLDLVARELDGEERAEWWDRAVEVFSNYAEYQQKTERLIPIFILES